MGFVVEQAGPVCLPEWKGKDNGGATYQGVTKDAIKVVALVPNELQMAAVTPTQRPVNYATGGEGTVTDVLNDGLAAYEHVFGGAYTYGRDIELEFVTSTGDDEAAQRADAVTVRAEKPFVVLDNVPSRPERVRHRDGGGEDPRLLPLRHRRRDPGAGSVPLGPAGPHRGVDERRGVRRQATGGQEGAVRR